MAQKTHVVLLLVVLLAGLLAGALPASAGVIVTIDAPTLQKLLAAVVNGERVVSLTADTEMRVQLDELRILGLEPSTAKGSGRILASLAVRAPDLGMSMRLKPRVALDVVKNGGTNLLDVRLEGLEIPLPFGTIDLGSVLPPIRYPATSAFDISGSSGDVEVQSVLTGITMDRERVRFELELEVME